MSKVVYLMLLSTPFPDLSSPRPFDVCCCHEQKIDLVFFQILAHEGSLWVLIHIMGKPYVDVLNDEVSEPAIKFIIDLFSFWVQFSGPVATCSRVTQIICSPLWTSCSCQFSILGQFRDGFGWRRGGWGGHWDSVSVLLVTNNIEIVVNICTLYRSVTKIIFFPLGKCHYKTRCY